MSIITRTSIQKSTLAREETMIFMISLSFIVWSSFFIYRTSFIAIDGQRYFCLFDDAMISMRYAWNLSHGNGLVWNAGDPVMGYTNLLMALLMSLATRFFDKSIAVLSIQILGIGLMLGIALVTRKIVDSMLPDDKTVNPYSFLIRNLTFGVALLYYPLSYWTLMGMETGLLTLLVLLAVLFAIQYAKKNRFRDLLLVSLCLGMAFMARNDSMIYAAVIWAYILWKIVHDRPGKTLPLLLYAVILYLFFVAGQTLFQYLYYGNFLPNTYILKLTGMPLADRVINGSRFVLPFLIQTSFLFVAAVAALSLSFNQDKLFLLALVLSALSYQIYVGGDSWNYWRILSPVMPLLDILFLFGITKAVSNSMDRRRQKERFSLSNLPRESQIYFLAFLGVLVMNSYFLPEIISMDRPFYVSANEHNVNTALALQDITTSDATAGVLWAGAIPYFSERKGIDFLGKSDRYIAKLPPDLSGKVSGNGTKSLPGHNKYDLGYSIGKLRPTFVQEFKWGGQDLSNWAETRYVKVEYKGMELYLLKNSPTVLWDRIKGQ